MFVLGVRVMKQVSAFLAASALLLSGCHELSEEALRGGMTKLNDLEDKAFAMATIDGAGRFVVVVPRQELQTVVKEARHTVLLGCIGKARDNLVATLNQIIVAQAAGSGQAAMDEAWRRALAYRFTVEACEKILTS